MRDVDPDGRPTLGWQVLQFIEKYLVHGPGDVQGDPIQLDDELAAFILRCYALDPATGRRVYDEALLSRPKGRAKSELAGMLVCAEALGPVRFDRWERGEPVGRAVTYPFIRALATEEGQSSHTYLNVAYMLTEARDRHPDIFGGVDIGRDWQSSTRTYLPGGGEVRPSTASSAAKDGGKESFSVADETHLYTLPETRAMYRTVKRNTAKRRAAQGWMLQTSTMYAPGEASVAEATHEAVRVGKAGRLLFDHKGVDEEIDLDDDPALDRALRFVYGPFIEAMDLDRLKAELRDPGADENEQRRYFLNERRAGSARWIDPRTWAARADVERAVPADRQPVTLGFDGAISRDAAALVGCTRDRHWFVVDVWERPAGAHGDGWLVPVDEVDQAVRTAFSRWHVVRMYCDPAWWQGWIAGWSEQFEKRVVDIHTNSAARWAPAVEAADTAVRQGEMTHDGDHRLARHVANAHKLYVRLRVDDGERRPFVLQKDRPNSPRKIDAAVAGILADHARNDAIAAGELVEVDYDPLRSVW